MTESFKLLGMGLLYLLTVILGCLLHKQKKPYIFMTLTVHKLISLTYFSLYFIYIFSLSQYNFIPLLASIIIGLTIPNVLILFISGILILSQKKFSKSVYISHLISTILFPILATVTITSIL